MDIPIECHDGRGSDGAGWAFAYPSRSCDLPKPRDVDTDDGPLTRLRVLGSLWRYHVSRPGIAAATAFDLLLQQEPHRRGPVVLRRQRDRVSRLLGTDSPIVSGVNRPALFARDVFREWLAS